MGAPNIRHPHQQPAGTSLAKLRQKRIRIHRQLDKLEPLLAAYYFKLGHIEAQIQVIAPELDLQARHRTRQPNPHFIRGELPRIALAILRECGQPCRSGS